MDILTDFYPWVKTLHLAAVISWMAGVLYLPRLFVRHAESVDAKSKTDALFVDMEQKLYSVIVTPAMGVAWICGILLALTPGIISWVSVWPYVKLMMVILLSAYTGYLGSCLKTFENGMNEKSGRYFRIINEVPAVIMLVILVCVVVRPF